MAKNTANVFTIDNCIDQSHSGKSQLKQKFIEKVIDFFSSKFFLKQLTKSHIFFEIYFLNLLTQFSFIHGYTLICNSILMRQKNYLLPIYN